MGRFIKNANIRGADQYVVRIPYGESTVRPVNPNDGQTRFNTTTGILEVYYNNSWQNFTMVGNTTVVKDTFTGDGSSIVFGAMSYAYSSGEETQPVVFVDNVHQNPNVAYTFNSSFAITFTSPPPSGKTIIVLHNYASTDYTGAPFVAPFLPSDLSSLSAWHRFNVGITQAGGFVSQWDDQSGNGRHQVQAVGTFQPSVADGVITYDGVDNFTESAGSWAGYSPPVTTYILIKQITWTNADTIIDAPIGNFARIYQGDAGPGSPSLVSSHGGSIQGGSEAILGEFHIICQVIDGASSLIQIDNNIPATGTHGSQPLNGLSLGAFNTDTPAAWANVAFKEVIRYNAAHDADTRTQVIDYLGTL